MGLERAYAACVGQGERLVVTNSAQVDIRGSVRRSDGAEEA
jgi:hypothetical protein